MKQTVCDHCGRLAKYKGINITIGGYETEADLCGEHLGELVSIVERFIDGEEVGEQGDR